MNRRWNEDELRCKLDELEEAVDVLDALALEALLRGERRTFVRLHRVIGRLERRLRKMWRKLDRMLAVKGAL